MTEKIQIPDSVNDMGLEHLRFYLELASLMPEGSEYSDELFDNLTALQVADLNTLFFNKPEGTFDKFTDEANRQVLAEIALSSTRQKPETVKPEIEINGTTYVFQTDYSKQPVSFHRDISKCDFKENPLDMVAFCYIEKGMIYNELDEKTKTILNPRRERAQVFDGHFNLAQFLALQGFFLDSKTVLSPYLKIRKAKLAQS